MKFINDFKVISTKDADLNQLVSMLYFLFGQIARIFNKNVHFADNIYGEILKVPDSGAPNSEIEIPHNLRVIPSKFMVISADKLAYIYRGTSAWTNTKIYLKCSTSNTSFEVFIW